jgi:predicted NBD/HSP70 family sugar kinase
MPDQPTGGDLSRLRQLNALAVIHALRGGSPPTLTELSRKTGLSRPSTEDVVRDLLDQGWVEEMGPVAGSMGRPARRYRFRADAGHALGVDVGGHKMLAVVTDLEGNVLNTARMPVAIDAGRSDRLAVMEAVIGQCLAGAGLTGQDVWSAGVGTTGLVDAAGRVLLSVALPEWTGVDLAGHVGQQVSGSVLVENDSKLAALAESWRGVARHAKDVVYLLAGLRTGAGLIIDGKLHRGFANAAGEIGALPQVGWIRAQEHLSNWPGLPDGIDSVDAAGYVFAAARDGDRKALAAVRRYVKDMAVGAAALVLTLDPELVVLGGGFSRSADVLIQPFRKELDKLCIRTPEVLTSSLGDESVALGAVKFALDRLEQQVFDERHGLAAPSIPRR